jgi:hypothetical protein
MSKKSAALDDNVQIKTALGNMRNTHLCKSNDEQTGIQRAAFNKRDATESRGSYSTGPQARLMTGGPIMVHN